MGIGFLLSRLEPIATDFLLLGDLRMGVHSAVKMGETDLANCLQAGWAQVKAMETLPVADLNELTQEHAGHFARVCQLGNDKADALNDFLAIKQELTQVNQFGDRSENPYTAKLGDVLNKAATTASYLSAEARELLQSNTTGIASFEAVYHEISNPPPKVSQITDTSKAHTASVGDFVAIQCRPSVPWPFFVKITSITNKVGDQTSPNPDGVAYAEAAKKGETLSFEIQAEPSYDPTQEPPIDSNRVDHFYAGHVDANGKLVHTTITWKVSLNTKTGELSVSASGDHEFCNLNASRIQTSPLLSSSTAGAALNATLCMAEWRGAQDMMWEPFTRSFLMGQNGNYKPGLSASSCQLTVQKTVGKSTTTVQSVPASEI